MRKLFIISVAVFISIFNFNSLQAQRSISLIKNELIGKWKVTCALKKENMAGVTYCDLCSDFEITADSILLSDEKSNQKIAYNWEVEREIYRFTYKGIDREFQLYFADEYFILQEKGGCILLLQKMKK